MDARQPQSEILPMKSNRVSIALVVALFGLSTAETAMAAEKAKVVAQPAVRSRNYGAVQIRTADLTPQTKYDFKTVQWGYGPGIYARAYYPGYYSYPRWGYYNYYRPYPAYYAYRPYYYAGGPPSSYA